MWLRKMVLKKEFSFLCAEDLEEGEQIGKGWAEA